MMLLHTGRYRQAAGIAIEARRLEKMEEVPTVGPWNQRNALHCTALHCTALHAYSGRASHLLGPASVYEVKFMARVLRASGDFDGN
jgi:hypothetical protein